MSKDKANGPKHKRKCPMKHHGKGKGKANWHRPYPQGYRIPKLEPSEVDSVLNMARTLNVFTSKEKEKMNRNFYTQMIQEMECVNTSINLELSKIDETLTKITSDINDLKRNGRASAKLHKSTIDRLDIIFNKCDRIVSKFQVQDYEIEGISLTSINEQVKFLTNHVLEMVKHTNKVSTHLARSENERQKLKDGILAHVEKIHKNNEPSPHMPRNSTPLTKENLSVKESLTPFLGENVISAKDIPRLQEWPNVSGEGEYNHIELTRTIDMLQE
ncbi:hypothetical protein O181_019790 [Austropuccinia psidii MF-1]|uniref:Uncharacterized protein n=1 Tax=Austropuccinia psidii MF-1 TaxID=1389203 RepID=A0A9Q3CCJ5_9BASI|nr:hypothetical protein [Austropuccinia psidii MF-1]